MQYRPTEAQLVQMKKPVGKLFAGNSSETMSKVVDLVKRTSPPRVVMVGDVVSEEAIRAGVPVNLRIVDHKTMRKPFGRSPGSSQHVFSLTNYPGTISEDAFSIIRSAMSYNEALIIVEGEEDLLTIPAVLESPDNSIVVYGQPMEGAVVILAKPEVKKRMKQFLDQMIREN